jgi:amino acid permease
VSGWCVTTSWLFYGITIASIFVHRRRERRGAVEKPAYRAPLMPLTPILFIVATVAIIASDLTSTGWKAWAGVAIAALGFPVFFAWKGRRAAEI